PELLDRWRRRVTGYRRDAEEASERVGAAQDELATAEGYLFGDRAPDADTLAAWREADRAPVSDAVQPASDAVEPTNDAERGAGPLDRTDADPSELEHGVRSVVQEGTDETEAAGTLRFLSTVNARTPAGEDHLLLGLLANDTVRTLFTAHEAWSGSSDPLRMPR